MMRRVSSRQRLVSWDAFDASASTVAELESSCDTNMSIPALVVTGAVGDLSSKRKRDPASSSSCWGKTAAASSSFPNVIPATPLEMPQPRATHTCSPCSLEHLNDDVQLCVLRFCDLPALRTMMQVNHRYRRLIASDEARTTLWRDLCQCQWPGLLGMDHAADLVDDFAVPTAALLTRSSPNVGLLLSLAARTASTRIDDAVFRPTWVRVLRSNQLHVLRGHTELRLVQSRVTAGQAAVRFTGQVGMGDRCIRADQPLPRPRLLTKAEQQKAVATASTVSGAAATTSLGRKWSIFHRLLINKQSRYMPSRRLMSTYGSISHHDNSIYPIPWWRPFVAPFLTRDQQHPERVVVYLTPRLCSYFEVTIHHNDPEAWLTPADPNDVVAARPADGIDGSRRPHWTVDQHLQADEDDYRLRQSRRHAQECVAVGLANSSFAIHSRMPGWDSHSFGYHGDDGGIFHASGHLLREFGPRFGAGDTVGCGLDYARSAIFYTLNGRFLGYAFEELSREFLFQSWYPVVGMDTSYLVTCNFGMDRPFLFDLNQMLRDPSHRDMVLQCLMPLKR